MTQIKNAYLGVKKGKKKVAKISENAASVVRLGERRGHVGRPQPAVREEARGDFRIGLRAGIDRRDPTESRLGGSRGASPTSRRCRMPPPIAPLEGAAAVPGGGPPPPPPPGGPPPPPPPGDRRRRRRRAAPPPTRWAAARRRPTSRRSRAAVGTQQQLRMMRLEGVGRPDDGEVRRSATVRHGPDRSTTSTTATGASSARTTRSSR